MMSEMAWVQWVCDIQEYGTLIQKMTVVDLRMWIASLHFVSVKPSHGSVMHCDITRVKETKQTEDNFCFFYSRYDAMNYAPMGRHPYELSDIRKSPTVIFWINVLHGKKFQFALTLDGRVCNSFLSQARQPSYI